MNIKQATRSYESWLAKHLSVNSADLKYKHQRMSEAALPFFRATFYRYIQQWDQVCREFRSTLSVLAVGDLHIENFGTWRDLDGRLIWGINDFDEVFELPYVFDLIRLATSSALAINSGHFKIETEDAIDAIINGYQAYLAKNGEAFVLEEKHHGLRNMALGELRKPAEFWAKFKNLLPAAGLELTSAKKVLQKTFPKKISSVNYFNRVSGLGSLGRMRVVGLADFGGSLICREAKWIVPSAVVWARDSKNSKILCEKILKKAVRVPDPYHEIRGQFIVRRLAPHCSRIDLGHLPKRRDEIELLTAMGAETANVHVGQGNIKQLRRDFSQKRKKEIKRAVTRMVELVMEDWDAWRIP
jgi:uncharacterized protein (DUF2252 family)